MPTAIPMPNSVLVAVNATGRQAASVCRVAAAIGYEVRAHVNQIEHPVAKELGSKQHITVIEGSLADKKFVADLFVDASRAFINTLTWGDEVAIGRSLADAAKRAGIKHYVGKEQQRKKEGGLLIQLNRSTAACPITASTATAGQQRRCGLPNTQSRIISAR